MTATVQWAVRCCLRVIEFRTEASAREWMSRLNPEIHDPVLVTRTVTVTAWEAADPVERQRDKLGATS